MTESDLTGSVAYEHPSAECDLIMKGGISSGIVYPRAACRLAMTYRFRRLGGASAGAIAAAAVAAAEHGRDGGGFLKLAGLPTALGSRLADLFQPSPATKPAFAVLSAWLEPDWSGRRKLGRTAGIAVRRAWWMFGLVLLLLLLPGVALLLANQGPRGLGWLAAGVTGLVWVPTALVLALAAAASVVGVRTLRALPGNGFGLCDGHSTDADADQPPLTDWLSATFDDLAGRSDDDGPLTFGHLWGADAVALERAIAEKDDQGKAVPPEERARARAARVIDVEVMTTNLTFRRPYRFPFDTRIFHFCERRMRTYFPEDVVTHLVKTSAETSDKTDTVDGVEVAIPMRCPCHGEQVRTLPRAWDLPVVLAARLSLSFPGLISAVPLFCVDWSRGPGKRALIEVWFSDGGIASNFPMHLFDALWPVRPTFGINLSAAHPDYDAVVWKPARHGSVLPRSHPIPSMPAFLHSIVDTMQNWVDTTQITMPGFRDRVAAVRQRDGEGGINLTMPAPVIEDLADRGAEAAALFDDFDFDLHRWIRYRVAMSELDGLLTGMHTKYATGWDEFLEQYREKAPSYRLGSTRAVARDQHATHRLMDVAETWAAEGHPSNAGSVPRPSPVLRIVPRQ